MRIKLNNIIFMASNEGGHFSQLLALSPIFGKYKTIIITDNPRANKSLPQLKDVFNIVFTPGDNEMRQKLKNKKNRTLTRWNYIPGYISMFYDCFKICQRYRPKIIVSTGSDIAVPLFIWGKLYGAKTVYIETRAKVYSKTLSGKLLTNIATKIIVQWPEMVKVYKGKAEYFGTLI